MSLYPEGGPERRAALTARIIEETGLTETVIARVVDRFYDRIRADPVLGPVFAARIADERWPAHLAQMRRFWSSVALMTGDYHGRPMPAHLPLPISGADFDHWLALFRDTATTICTEAGAALLIDRAGRIAASLEMGIAVGRGQMLRRGERLSSASAPEPVS